MDSVTDHDLTESVTKFFTAPCFAFRDCRRSSQEYYI